MNGQWLYLLTTCANLGRQLQVELSCPVLAIGRSSIQLQAPAVRLCKLQRLQTVKIKRLHISRCQTARPFLIYRGVRMMPAFDQPLEQPAPRIRFLSSSFDMSLGERSCLACVLCGEWKRKAPFVSKKNPEGSIYRCIPTAFWQEMKRGQRQVMACCR